MGEAIQNLFLKYCRISTISNNIDTDVVRSQVLTVEKKHTNMQEGRQGRNL